MDEFDDLNEYSGNAEHDMWVDFTYQENIHDTFDGDSYQIQWSGDAENRFIIPIK